MRTIKMNKVNATSFADPADIRAFRRCKDRGGSDDYCFKKGDNGIGLWGDDVSEGTGPSCALPPDDMIDRWGEKTPYKSTAERLSPAKHKSVVVKRGDKTATIIVKDRMPWRKNIHNGAGIDLNPDACAALGLKPPVFTKVEWMWL